MTARITINSDDGPRKVVVPSVGGEAVVIPLVRALIQRSDGAILLQKRAKPGEPVLGKWELPGGRWTAGETAETVIRREIAQETGLVVTHVEGSTPHTDVHGVHEVLSPVVVVTGAEGRFPLHVTVVRVHTIGEPRGIAGETADPTWMSAKRIRALLADDRAACVPSCAAILEALVAAGEI